MPHHQHECFWKQIQPPQNRLLHLQILLLHCIQTVIFITIYNGCLQMDRLHRTRLLFGETATEKLADSTVMVVGCGAVGSFAIEALARTGIGHIIVVGHIG